MNYLHIKIFCTVDTHSVSFFPCEVLVAGEAIAVTPSVVSYGNHNEFNSGLFTALFQQPVEQSVCCFQQLLL